MIHKWTTCSDLVFLETNIYNLHKVKRCRPGNSEICKTFYVFQPPNWVNVIAITPQNQLVMIRQYRQGTDSITLEVPGGMVEQGEEPLLAAKRELREETGFTSSQWAPLGYVLPNPAIQNNRCDTFLALNAIQNCETDFDEDEDIEVEYVDVDSLEDAIKSHKITHSLIICAIHFYQQYCKK